MFKLKQSTWWLVLMLAMIVVWMTPSSDAADHRLVVQMAEPFEVNGTLYAPGELAMKHVHTYSPVMTLTEVRIDGAPIGFLIARENGGAPVSTEDRFVFSRNTAGHLVLHAVEMRGDLPRELYRFRMTDDGGVWFAPQNDPLLVAASR